MANLFVIKDLVDARKITLRKLAKELDVSPGVFFDSKKNEHLNNICGDVRGDRSKGHTLKVNPDLKEKDAQINKLLEQVSAQSKQIDRLIELLIEKINL